MWSVFVNDDGHKRGPTSGHVFRTEIQRDCNFEAHVEHFSNRLGCMSIRWFILLSRLPYWPLVQLNNYTILPDKLNRLVHKDFPRSKTS